MEETDVDSLIDYAERAGIDNMRERIEVASIIQREAHHTVALMLAGAGAALAYSAGSEADSRIVPAALSVSFFLFAIAGVLGWKCLGLIAYPAISNEPRNLLQDGYAVDQIRRFELDNLQTRIEQAVSINEARSRWLNRCRTAAVLTPLIALAAFWAAY